MKINIAIRLLAVAIVGRAGAEMSGGPSPNQPQLLPASAPRSSATEPRLAIQAAPSLPAGRAADVRPAMPAAKPVSVIVVLKYLF